MMYYWIVKHDGSEDQDLISCREELGTFRQDYVVVESLSPLLKNASFALGRRISTDRTWRDLNDAIITHLQSQSVQDNKEQPTLGLNVGTVVAFKSTAAQNMKPSFSKSRGGIF